MCRLEQLGVVCVFSTYVLCVFVPQFLPLFNFLVYCCGGKLLILHAHHLVLPIHERIFGF